MPTIEVTLSDFESLLKEKLDQGKLEDFLEKVKGEVKDFMPETDSTKIELNDTNRPDLWSPEGIARQVRPAEKPWLETYPFFEQKLKPAAQVHISNAVSAVRPYLAACISRNMSVTEPILEQLIQVQEKLADSFGRNRQMVSIGLYRLKKINFPVYYDLVDPERTAFVPLGFETSMTLREIIEKHPKGIAYANTLAGADQFPILKDAGEVEAGDAELFVEVTGTDLRMVTLAINIFAANLADRGADIEAVELHYAQETDFGTVFQTPYDLSEPVTLTLSELNRVLGETVTVDEAVNSLKSYGLDIDTEGEKMTVRAAPYRDDLMHPIDVVEDFAISRGYDSFDPVLPSTFTVGALSEIEQFSDALRHVMTSLGFEEVVSNILGSSEDFIEKMALNPEDKTRPETRIVEIENPMTERFSLLRSWILPSLLRVEGTSSKAFYPHRIFEAGEVARLAPETPDQTETTIQLGALIAHPAANFSELHALLDALFSRLKGAYQLDPATHPSFIPGRFGHIVVDGREVGLIGEIQPAVLDFWQIGMPTAAFELMVEKL